MKPRPDSESWKAAFAVGSAGEDELERLLAGYGWLVDRVNLPGADFRATILIECKVDRRAADTGRVCVEVSRDGKPSGLAASDSSVWATRANGSWYFTPTARLRELVAGRPAVRAGDGGRTGCVLIDLHLLAGLSLVVPAEPAVRGEAQA